MYVADLDYSANANSGMRQVLYFFCEYFSPYEENEGGCWNIPIHGTNLAILALNLAVLAANLAILGLDLAATGPNLVLSDPNLAIWDFD